jgi:hypothetical protein
LLATVNRLLKNIPDVKISVGRPGNRWLGDVKNGLKKHSQE